MLDMLYVLLIARQLERVLQSSPRCKAYMFETLLGQLVIL